MRNLELKMAKLRLEGLRNTAEYTNLEKEVVNQPHASEEKAFEVKKENNRKGLDALTLELIGVNKHSNNSIVFESIEYTIETLKDLKEVSEIVFIENELNGVTLEQVKRLIKNLFPEIEEKETQIENVLLANEPINAEQFNFYKQELIEQGYKYFVVDNNKRKSLSVYPCFDLEVAGIIRDNCNNFLVLLEWDTAWEAFKNIFHF